MRVFADRSARTMILTGAVAIASACILNLPAALASAAGSAKKFVFAEAPTLAQASELIQANKLIEAKSIIESLLLSPATSQGDRNAAGALLQMVNARISTANPIDLSLQRATLALANDDLRQAERQASAVLTVPSASAEWKAKAQEVLDAVAKRKASLQGQVPAVLDKAQNDFNAGRFADARSGVETLNKWGLQPAEADQARLDALQLKIVEIAKISGGAITDGGITTSPAPTPGPTPASNADSGVRLVEDQTIAPPAGASTSAPAPALPAVSPQPFYPAEKEQVAQASPPRISEGGTAMTGTVEQAAPAAAPAPAGAHAPAPAPEAAPAPQQPEQLDLVALALRAEAQRSLFEADQSYDGGRYAEATRKYESVLAGQRQYLSPEDIARAEQRLAQARVRLQSPTGGTLEQSVEQNFTLVREKTIAEFENGLTEAQSALKAGNADRAATLAVGAQLALDRARTYFSQAEYDKLSDRASALKAEISKEAEAIATRNRAESEAKAGQVAKKAEQDLRAAKERRISDSIARIRALQREQKYEEAQEIVAQVLFMDPVNPSALLLRDIISDVIAFRRADEIGRRKRVGMQTLKIQNREATIPPTELVTYPTDWPQLTMMRTGAGGYYETPANRAAIASLEGTRIPVQFNGVPLGNALAYIGKSAGVDIDPDWRSLATIGVSAETPITMNFNADQPAKQVLEKVISRLSADKFARADFAIKNGIVEVGSADSIKQQTVVEHYPITDLLAVAPDYADVPETDLSKIVKSQARRAESVGRETRDPFAIKAEGRNKSTGDRRERVRALVQMIQQNIDADSWRDNGGDTGTIMELNSVLVITATPRNHREITGLLSRLREIRQTQINVETRFLLVNQDFFEQISFDLDVYFNNNGNQVQNARQIDPNVRASDFFAFPTNQYLRRTLDSDIYGNTAGGNRTTVTPFISGGQGNDPGSNPPRDFGLQQTQPRGWSPIGVSQNSGRLAEGLTPSTNTFVSGLLAASPALGIAGTYMDDIQVDFLIKATQADRRTITLNAPRLTFTNGQIANVVVGTQRGFVSDLEIVTGDSAVGFDPTPDSIADGVTLLVEGVASADRRYVTLNVEAGVSTIQELVNFPVSATAGTRVVTSDTVGGPGSVSSSVQLPLLNVSQVNTTVTVPDQGTILLGGQRLSTELQIETGVPVLSKIPVINRFFTNRIESRQDATLLILLKPTVLVQSEQEERFFPGLNDALRSGN